MLEKKSGVSRTTVYFYIRQGLLPDPQKTSTGRSLYGEHHVRLLQRIGELKRAGLSLPEIRQALAEDLARACESEVDLESQENERMRQAIIEAATDEFVSKGYKGTHVLAIIQKLGTNPHVFYRHFPSKLELLAACFKSAAPLPLDPGERTKQAPGDPVENVLRGLTSDLRWHRLSAVLAGAIRSEEQQDREALRRLAETWDAVIVNPLRDIREARAARSTVPAVMDELLAYSLIGAHRSTSMRASWDERFGSDDLLRAHLFVFLALMAAVGGEVDIDSRVARYEPLIQELTAGRSDLPPALEV